MGTDQPDIAEIVAETMVAVETIARALHVKEARLEPTLDAIITNAAATHPAADDAGVILLVRGKLVPQATTGRPPQILDLWQQETGEGPCVEAASKQTVICISDTGDDARWPGFCAEAQACGVRAMLCAPLWVDEECMGTLTLFSQQAAAFGAPDIKLIELFAALAALSLAEAQRTGNLREAMVNRDLIGQAKGILMERYKIDGETAFGMLARASQDLNLKLAAIARHLTETGEMLGPTPA
ncbi:MAG: GAF and ANTAR domain-containing protein [Streptosporangiaceae bacterium]